MDDCDSSPAEPVMGAAAMRPDLPQENVTEVTSADYNGRTFDGRPLDPPWPWVIDAVNIKDLRIEPSETDYAVWSVPTPQGRKLAWPGDFIVRNPDDTLDVIQDESNINRKVA